MAEKCVYVIELNGHIRYVSLDPKLCRAHWELDNPDKHPAQCPEPVKYVPEAVPMALLCKCGHVHRQDIGCIECSCDIWEKK